jgi:hypothetical protein
VRTCSQLHATIERAHFKAGDAGVAQRLGERIMREAFRCARRGAIEAAPVHGERRHLLFHARGIEGATQRALGVVECACRLGSQCVCAWCSCSHRELLPAVRAPQLRSRLHAQQCRQVGDRPPGDDDEAGRVLPRDRAQSGEHLGRRHRLVGARAEGRKRPVVVECERARLACHASEERGQHRG